MSETPRSSPGEAFERMEVDADLRARLLKIGLELPPGVYNDSFEDRGKFLDKCMGIRDALAPTAIGEALLDLREGRRTTLQIDRLPLDPSLPDPPMDGGSPLNKRTFVSEGIASGIAWSLGAPSLMLGEKDEALVHQIVPVPGRETSLSNAGSVPLGFHQDMGPNAEAPYLRYDKFMPDWLILSGLKKGSGATSTLLSSVQEAAERMDPRMLDVLRQKRFMTNPPASFLTGDNGDAWARETPVHPIFADYKGHLESAFDSTSGTRPADPADTEGFAALKAYEEALGQVSRSVVIAPGTTVIFNNRRAVHGRGAVQPGPTATERRWLQRLYVFDIGRAATTASKHLLALQAGGGLLRASPAYINSPTPELRRLMIQAIANPEASGSEPAPANLTV